MRTIPVKLKKQLEADPEYKRCMLSGEKTCIEWHHCFIYAGKQINERWAIVALSKWIHRESPYSVHNNAKTMARVKLLALGRATSADLAKYPKFDWGKEALKLARAIEQ